ncbi:MAG TPA: hypothetical protein VHF90_07910 [Thermoleophilaceae bacterium]|nr:hypothetical protein [Thermoleophilaceae bacterium]
MIADLIHAGATSPPAGGAATGEIALATVSATLLTLGLLYLGDGHRRGTVSILARIAAFSTRVSGQPGWAAFPAALATVSLLAAVIGMYWDIALHVDVGRDEGPLANPAHYFILAGLYGIFAAGFFAMVLPKEKPSASSIRLGRDWHAPLGGVLICACGAFALLGFPLDDVWHRLFGQDVTLWGPTHLMLIGGASMTLVGIAVLQTESRRSMAAAGKTLDEAPWIHRLRLIALTGGLLLGMSTFQAEFDFGIGQFRLIFQPMLIMLAAGVVLVAARVWLGRGAALGAVLFFILIRGFLAVLVGPILGETTPHFPLYLASAAVVELLALAIAAERRPLAFGLWAGVSIGTVGLAAEWGFSQLWMPLPWTAALFPEGALLGFAIAVCASLIGAWVGAHLASETIPRTPSLRAAGAIAAAGVAAMVLWALYTPPGPPTTVAVTTRDVERGAERAIAATVRFDPPDAAEDAEWLTATAWQGDGLVVDRLERVREGVYRTTEPIPVHGNWKSMIRLQRGNAIDAAPLFLPEDPAIPAAEVPAPASFTRELIPDSKVLQREQKTDVAGTLTAIAYSVVAAIALSLLALLAWGLHRLAVTSGTPPRGRTPLKAERPAILAARR